MSRLDWLSRVVPVAEHGPLATPVRVARDEWPAGYWLPHGRCVVGLLAHGAVVVDARPLGSGRWQVTVSACGWSAPPVTWAGGLRAALRVTRRTIGEDLTAILLRLAEREPVPWRTVAALAAAAAELT